MEPAAGPAAAGLRPAPSLPPPASASERLAGCLRSLEAARLRLVGPEEPSAAPAPATGAAGRPAEGGAQDRRAALLAEKRALGDAMEALRGTMRTLQEDSERCTVEAGASEARLLSAEALAAAARDELGKVAGQARRSREQAQEHADAGDRLRRALASQAEAFQASARAEAEAHARVGQEVAQLQQVTQDLETRLRAKAAEIDRLSRANAATAEEAAAAAEACRRAREARAESVDAGPLGRAIRLLGEISEALEVDGCALGACSQLSQELQREIHDQLWDGIDPTKLVQEETGEADGSDARMDLATLRDMVARKDEQLARLHRKIRFLSERECADAASDVAAAAAPESS